MLLNLKFIMAYLEGCQRLAVPRQRGLTCRVEAAVKPEKEIAKEIAQIIRQVHLMACSSTFVVLILASDQCFPCADH